MLDSYLGRPNTPVAQWLDNVARWLASRDVRADTLSWLALGLGLLGATLLAAGALTIGWCALGISGVLDAVDGRVARLGKGPTPWGGVLDLVGDRVVEAAVLLALSLPHPQSHIAALFLLATWYVNITVFLAVGAASRGAAEKVIVYPPGLLERSEALVFLAVVVFVPASLTWVCWVYGVLGLVTGLQRLVYGWRELGHFHSAAA